MKSPKALLLYNPGSKSSLLHSATSAGECEIEEAPLNRRTAAPIDRYCLVLFDIDRPASTLLDTLRAWRDSAPATTVFVAGSRISRSMRIALLETGASYLIKPVNVQELRARVRAVLLRSRPEQSAPRHLAFGEGTIDLDARRIDGPGGTAHLTPTEFGILDQLSRHMNQTVSRGQLVKSLWGMDPQKGAHSLRRFIRGLRRKIEPDPANPKYLVTEPTIGYRLQSACIVSEQAGP